MLTIENASENASENDYEREHRHEFSPRVNDNWTYSARSFEDRSRSANEWALRIFPDVAQQFLMAFIEVKRTDQNDLTRAIVRDLNDNFWACALGNLGNPLMPVVYLSSEQQFYRYNRESGIFDKIDEDGIMALLSMFLDKCVGEVGGLVYFEDLVRLKHSRRLRKVVTRAKTLLAVGDEYFPPGWSCLPLSNGILDTAKMKLLPYGPSFHFKSRLPVTYDPKCAFRLIRTPVPVLSGQ